MEVLVMRKMNPASAKNAMVIVAEAAANRASPNRRRSSIG